MKSTPMTVRETAPSPPRMLVPPTTILARTVLASAVSPVEAHANAGQARGLGADTPRSVTESSSTLLLGRDPRHDRREFRTTVRLSQDRQLHCTERAQCTRDARPAVDVADLGIHAQYLATAHMAAGSNARFGTVISFSRPGRPDGLNSARESYHLRQT